MSGYTGNPDAEAEHAAVIAENGIHSCRSMLTGNVNTHCTDCGEEIQQARREAALSLGHKCEYCITCQVYHDTPRKVKMLDRIL